MSVLTLSGYVSPWGISASFVREKLSEMSGDIEVHISSYGGSVYEGVEIFNLLKNYSKNNGRVTTVNISKCMSIASLIFLAGDTKKAYANATIMGHKSWTFAVGDTDDMKRESNILDGIDGIIASTYKTFQTEKSIEDIKDEMAVEMWYIGEEQLMASQFVDEIIEGALIDDALDSKEDGEKRYQDSKNTYEQEFKEHNVHSDLGRAENTLAACKGNCTLVENPESGNSASKQKTNKGVTVTKAEQLQADLDSANSTISTNEAEISAKDEKVASLEGENKVLAKGVVDAKASYDVKMAEKKEVLAEVVASMFNENGTLAVSKDVAVEMSKCDNIAASNSILINHLKSDGATVHGENVETEASNEPDEEMLAKAQDILKGI